MRASPNFAQRHAKVNPTQMTGPHRPDERYADQQQKGVEQK